MKKFLPLLLVLLLLAGTVHADVIWEPMDAFYQANQDKCAPENRLYIANGYGGSVNIYKSPADARVMETLENGTALYITGIYFGTKGKWGVLEFDHQGWVRMTDVYASYDAIAFEAERKSEFVSYNGEFFEFPDEVLFWEYPRASSHYTVQLNAYSDFSDTLPSFSYAYTDSEGLRWGYVSYYYLNRGWVCLDAPNDPDITPLPTPTPPPPVRPAYNPGPNPNRYLLLWAAGLVVLLAVIAAGLIWFFYRRKRK